jgi:hypothetical protein
LELASVATTITGDGGGESNGGKSKSENGSEAHI